MLPRLLLLRLLFGELLDRSENGPSWLRQLPFPPPPPAASLIYFLFCTWPRLHPLSSTWQGVHRSNVHMHIQRRPVSETHARSDVPSIMHLMTTFWRLAARFMETSGHECL